MSVTPTAPTPVSSFTIVASSFATSGPKPRAMSPSVRSATLSARAEDAAATRSCSRCRSFSTAMKSAAPTGFARIIGRAMIRTTSAPCPKGFVRK